MTLSRRVTLLEYGKKQLFEQQSLHTRTTWECLPFVRFHGYVSPSAVCTDIFFDNDEPRHVVSRITVEFPAASPLQEKTSNGMRHVRVVADMPNLAQI